MSSTGPYIPAFAMIERWLAGLTLSSAGLLRLPYDDLLDVLRCLIAAVPVDQDWYKAEYTAVADFVARSPDETPASHFQKHGYFEGRQPFAAGWRGMTLPVPFAHLQERLTIIPSRGRLWVEIERSRLLGLIDSILIALPVDPDWYRRTYPDAARDIDHGLFQSAADHFVRRGYFVGFLPFDTDFAEDWYLSYYGHVRIGLERGLANSPKDHFLRLGYAEGCRPTPP